MKLVSFGDVHMATRNLERMAAELSDTDLIVISGDLTNFGGADDARQVLDAARGVCARVLALPGNLDRREVIPYSGRAGSCAAWARHGNRRSRDFWLRRLQHYAI